MRFIWANIVSELEFGGHTISFRLLNGELMADHTDHRYGKCEYASMPRLVRTHALHDPRAFRDNRVVYLYRHPWDVMASYYAFRSAKRRRNRVAKMTRSQFIRDPKYGILAWSRHVSGWLPHATSVVSYEKLRQDCASEVQRILGDIGINTVSEAVVKKAVEASSFENTRRLEEQFGRPNANKLEPGFKFTRQGGTGEGRTVFDDEDRRYMESQLRRLSLPDDLAV
jgi:hypothetical protein